MEKNLLIPKEKIVNWKSSLRETDVEVTIIDHKNKIC